MCEEPFSKPDGPQCDVSNEKYVQNDFQWNMNLHGSRMISVKSASSMSKGLWLVHHDTYVRIKLHEPSLLTVVS